MPNADWYKKNRADIVTVAASLADYMLDNDELKGLNWDQRAYVIVDIAAALVAEVDQRGIAPMPTVPNCTHHTGMPRCTIPEEDYAD